MLTKYVASRLAKSSLRHYSLVPFGQQGSGGWHIGHGGLNRPAVRRTQANLGVQDCLTAQSSNLPRSMLQFSIWDARQDPDVTWGSAKKDVAWLLRRKNTIWEGLEPSSNIRHFGSGSYVDPELALGALVATNIGVTFLWKTVRGNFMHSNFVVSAKTIKQGRLHTLVTSAFSQIELPHLVANMIGLYCFGSEIGEIFGGQKLILLYLTGGIVGSLSHLANIAYLKPWIEGYQEQSPGLLGSSGAVNAIILLDILLFPTRIIYLNMIIPVPAALFGLVIIGSDLWVAANGSKTGSSPAAHLGGAFVGAIAWLKWQ